MKARFRYVIGVGWECPACGHETIIEVEQNDDLSDEQKREIARQKLHLQPWESPPEGGIFLTVPEHGQCEACGDYAELIEDEEAEDDDEPA